MLKSIYLLLTGHHNYLYLMLQTVTGYQLKVCVCVENLVSRFLGMLFLLLSDQYCNPEQGFEPGLGVSVYLSLTLALICSATTAGFKGHLMPPNFNYKKEFFHFQD